MKDSLIKKIIFGIIVIVIIIVAMIMILKNKNGKLNNFKNNNEFDINISTELENNISKLNKYDEYISIENMVQNYYLYLQMGNATAIYSILEKNYIKDNEISLENVVSRTKKYKSNELEFKAKEIYFDISQSCYYIFGNIYEDKILENVYYIFYVDKLKNVYTIRPISKEEYDLLILGKGNKVEINTNIKAETYNTMKQVTLSQEQIVEKIFYNYIFYLRYDIQYAYDILQKEYRENRFLNLDEFELYIQNNKDKIDSLDFRSMKSMEDFMNEEEYNNYINNLEFAQMEKYQVNKFEDYVEYVCVDSYNNYYIFNENSVMDYEVILDTYTIDLPQFLEKYEEGNEQVKVGMNIEKFISAINAKDYRYAYNCLADSFKNNYYQTQESFEDYVKNNFFENNKIEYIQFSKEGNNYVYDIKILNTQGEEEKQATIIMQLQEGTEFVMSFSIE